MLKLFIVACFFPMISFGQQSASVETYRQSITYSRAMEEYLKAISGKSGPDTLYVGRYEELKDIILLPSILNTRIILWKGDKEAENILKGRSQFQYVNIVKLAETKEGAAFVFVAFLVEKSPVKINWWPQYNCFIDLRYDRKDNDLKLDNQRLEYPYPAKP